MLYAIPVFTERERRIGRRAVWCLWVLAFALLGLLTI